MSNKQKGFTFIELMIVFAIIGILSAIVIPAYNDRNPDKVYLNDKSIRCKGEALYFKDTDWEGYSTYSAVLDPVTGMIRACVGTPYEIR